MAFEPLMTCTITADAVLGVELFKDDIRNVQLPDLEQAKDVQEYQTEEGVHSVLMRVTHAASLEFDVWSYQAALFAGVGKRDTVISVGFKSAKMGMVVPDPLITVVTGELLSPLPERMTPWGQTSVRIRQRVRKCLRMEGGQILEYLDSRRNAYAAGSFGSEEAAFAANQVADVDTQVLGTG